MKCTDANPIAGIDIEIQIEIQLNATQFNRIVLNH